MSDSRGLGQCPPEGRLRAMLDDELAPADRVAVEDHLSGCPACRETAVGLERTRDLVVAVLDVGETDVDARAALAELRSGAAVGVSRPGLRVFVGRIEEMKESGMNNLLRSRALAAGLAAVVVLALALTFAPVRAAAAQLLGIFRVRSIQTVEVDPYGMSQRFEALDIDPDDIVTVVSETQTDGAVARDLDVVELGLDEAADRIGFPLRAPAVGAPSRAVLEPGVDLELQVDGARLVAVLEELGLEPAGLAPETATVSVHTEPGVTAFYDRPEGQVVYSVVPSPTVTLPDGWDIDLLGRLYLTLLGVRPDEAAAMADTIDWTSTLVLPVPAGQASALDVRVDGVDGVLFRARDTGAPGEVAATTPESLLVWQRDGLLFALHGPVAAETLVALAGDMH